MRVLWGLFMTVFYLLMAFLLVFSDVLEMPYAFRIMIGILFFAYGLFRGYRVWKTDY